MDKQALALAITKALAFTENGGKPDPNKEQQGGSGEMKSLFQFLPATWKAYSKQVTGKDNLPLTPQNEASVVHGKVSQWLDQGYNTMQIASLWNAGHPDAYKDNIGVNKEGIEYNTPKYAKKVQNYTDEFMGSAHKVVQGDQGQIAENTPTPTPQQPAPQQAPQQNQGMLPILAQQQSASRLTI